MEIIRLNPTLIRFVKLSGGRKRRRTRMFVRYVRSHEALGVYEDQCVPIELPCEAEYVIEEPVFEKPNCLSPIEDGNAGATRRALLVTEMEDVNHWARSGFRMYAWYTVWFAFQFTVNLAAMSYFFASRGPEPWYARLVFAFFAGWSLLGIVTTFMVRRQILDCDQRISLIFDSLMRYHHRGEPDFWSESPIPRGTIMTVLIFCTVTMLFSLVFWMIVFLWPQALSA